MRRLTNCVFALALLTLGGSAQAAQISLTASDALNSTSFNTGLHWSNGLAPTNANTYVVSGYTLRTPPSGGNRTFAGSALTISGGGVLAFKGFDGDIITVNNLVLDGGYIGAYAGGGPTFTLAGNGITLGSGGGYFNTGASNRVTVVTAPISGSSGVSIVTDGTVQFSVPNSYGGNTAIGTTSTLRLNNAHAVQNSTVVGNPDSRLIFGGGLGTFNLGGLEGSAPINLTDTASTSINLQVGSNGQTTTFDGVLGGGGSLTKIGTGSLTLTNTNSYTGGTSVNNGALVVNGSILGAVTVNSGAALKGTGSIGGGVTVTAGGVVAPGTSPGALHINGDYTQAAVGELQIELGGSTPGTGYDQLLVSGTVTLAGTLNVSLTNGFSPLPGNVFEILNWGSLNGTFNTLNLPTLAENGVWNTSQLYSAGILSVSPVGDYNRDGIVDAADYVLWRKNVGDVVPLCSGGDANCNGFVENAEYQPWYDNYGRTLESTASAVGSGYSEPAAAVPEPSTLAIFLAAGLVILLQRDDRCRHLFQARHGADS